MFITDQIGDACISLKNEQNEPVLPVPSMKLKKKKKVHPTHCDPHAPARRHLETYGCDDKMGEIQESDLQ